MGLLSGIKTLISGGQNAGKLLDAGIAGFDKLILTEEEKLDARREMANLWMETQKVLQNETSPRSMNRRYVAWSIISLVWLCVVVSIVLACMGENDKVLAIKGIADSYLIGEGFIAIIIFYFGTHVIGAMKK